jgi:hypothetical protein
MKATKYFVLLQISAVITQENNVMALSEELTGITEHVTLQMTGCIN